MKIDHLTFYLRNKWEIERLAQITRNEMIKISDLKKNRNSNYPIHLALGHEYVSATIAKIRNPNDKFVLTHRNIHFNISLSNQEDYKKLGDETLALESGINNGNYGCMTLRNKKAGISYTSSILANNLSIGLGISSTLKNGYISWIQTGDGAIEEGAFYESMVFAKARGLPVLILVENNNWSLGSSIKERRSNINLSKLSKSIGFGYSFLKRYKSIYSISKVILRARKKALFTPQVVEIMLRTEGGKSSKERGYESYHSGLIKK